MISTTYSIYRNTYRWYILRENSLASAGCRTLLSSCSWLL